MASAIRRFVHLSFVVVAAFSLTCKDAGTEPETEKPPEEPEKEISFAQQIQPIFQRQQYGCLGCHGGSGNLFLTNAATSYANLVNRQAEFGCNDRKRVEPGNANQSVLYLRLSGFSCGPRMPRDAANPISTADLELIRNWINQGAKNN